MHIAASRIATAKGFKPVCFIVFCFFVVCKLKIKKKSLSRCVLCPGGASVPEPQGGVEEQPALHPGPFAGYLPAFTHHSVQV